MVLAEDDRFHEVQEEHRLRAFACYDTSKAADDRHKLQLVLADIEKQLRSMEPWTAVREQRKIA